jgi:hypothetical protein
MPLVVSANPSAGINLTPPGGPIYGHEFALGLQLVSTAYFKGQTKIVRCVRKTVIACLKR